MEKVYKRYRNRQELEKDYENFKDDWTVDAQEHMARHKSGVELYALDEYEQNGRRRLQIHREFSIGPNFPHLSNNELPKFFQSLNAQFSMIYEKQMPKIEHHERTDEERRKSMEETDKMRLQMLRDDGVPEDVIQKIALKFKEGLDEIFR